MKKLALILACCLVFTGCNSRNERYKGASEISDATESSSVISENSTYTSTNTENSESNSSSTSVSSNKPQSSSVLSSSSASSSKPQSSSGSSSSSASSSKPQSSSSSTPQSSSSSAAAPEVIGNYGRRAPESWETEFSEEVFRLVNLERVKYGLPELKKLDSLSETASIRAWECLVEYGHNRPDGRGFETALNEQGIKWCACGENIAAGKSTPEHVVSAWMNSEGHRANILSDKYEYLGVGFYYDKDNLGGGYRYYWAQNFCALF